jgi:hypothetical protein
MKLLIERTIYTDTTSSGALSIDGKWFCFTLEDAARAYGVKVQDKTCIPSGEYGVTITPSTRFERPMLHIYSDKVSMACELGAIRFTGIRVHGGTNHMHTAGCVLAGYTRVADDRIKDSAEKALLNRVASAMDVGEEVRLTVRNLEQAA